MLAMENYKILLFLGLLASSTFASAQTAPYYYSGGEKHYLVDYPEKVCVITPKSNTHVTQAPRQAASANKNNVIEDDLYNIEICNSNTSKSRMMNVQRQEGIILPCYKTPEGQEIYPTNYINVKLKEAKDSTLLRALAEKYDLKIISQDKFMPLWHILSITEATGMTSLDAANTIYETGLVASSVADLASDDMCVSYDPNVTKQWGLYNLDFEGIDINVSPAWNYATGRGVNIGILDTGIEKTHSDLARNISPLSFDTESETSPSRIYSDHGTHCAGIAAAVRNNGIFVAGVAPDAKLVAISNSLRATSNSRIKRADGFCWAWKNGVDIISNSWGSSTRHDVLEEAIDSALTKGRDGKGCVIVFAAGNDNHIVSYPANYRDNILTVGAIDSTGVRTYYSNYGDKLDVVAPGHYILSTIPGNTIGWMNGTSMACPHVAGVAALILERNPSLTARQVNDIIEKTARKITVNYDTYKRNGTWNMLYGYGLVDAYNAVMNTPR